MGLFLGDRTSGNGWIYHGDSNCYDTSPANASDIYLFGTTQGPSCPNVSVNPTLTALVVVDMQNFFLHPRCNDFAEGLTAAERILEVVAKCRELGIQIIWLNWGLTESDLSSMPPAVHRGFSGQLIDSERTGEVPNKQGQSRCGLGSNMGSGRGRLLMANSWNAELYESLLDASDKNKDIFCDKNRMSGMWSDDAKLCDTVKPFTTLLFAGVNSDQCVLGTLVDAYNRGYTCVMLEDCCATKTPGGQEVTTWNVAKAYGFVTDSKNFCDGGELRR
ncbi:Isochorismatase-like protein [Xylaria bambusicola]|uniref:Isochorismatase-like protein n=1 Tax=Xylaria bambusicola TaxID=326684 RepID=UPI0020086701|nr:Isochorismatase-like protein [Xylaria bambusicola]KAI0513036.1 Isochorismatase-like protein [Xylaria bambusicola]